MKMSDNITELAAALAAASAELRNPKNESDNPYYNSKYAELSDILDLVRPILSKHGLSIVQSPVTNENKNPGVASLLMHSSGQYVLFDPFYMQPAKTDPQAAGGAITYARRYSLNAILGICGKDEDDDGNGASAPADNAGSNVVPLPILCPVCGKPVKGVKGKDGVVSTPEQVLEKLGMCAACYKEKKKSDAERTEVAAVEEETII